MIEERFLKQFGKRLAHIRQQKGMTQEQVADRVELHRTYIGFIEQGKRNPSIANVYRIARTLKVHISELLKDL